MPRIVEGNNFKAIVVSLANGKEGTVHIQNPSNHLEIAGGFLGGFTCSELVELAPTAPDNAKCIVTSSGLSPFGVEGGSARSTETKEAILAAFKEAGFSLPRVEQQSRSSARWERIKHALHLRV